MSRPEHEQTDRRGRQSCKKCISWCCLPHDHDQEVERGESKITRAVLKKGSLSTEPKRLDGSERDYSCCCWPSRSYDHDSNEPHRETEFFPHEGIISLEHEAKYIVSDEENLIGDQPEKNTATAERRDTKRHRSQLLDCCCCHPQCYSDGSEDGHNQEEHELSEQKSEPEADTQVNVWKRLAVGGVSQKEGTRLIYTFNNPQFQLSKSPVIGWYSSHHCLNLQTNCARKILKIKTADKTAVELHAEEMFKAVLKEVPQTGSKQVIVAGTGWPDLAGGNVLMTPNIRDNDILMLLQRCVILSLCDCLILTVKDIDRHQLQSLLQILVVAKGNRTTVIIFHHVETKEEFETQLQLIEEFLPMPEISNDNESIAVEPDCSPGQVFQEWSVPSRKMKLFHCLGLQEEALLSIRLYIESSKFLDSLLERKCQGTMHHLFHQTIVEFAQLANLTEFVTLTEVETIDGSNHLTVRISTDA